MKNIIITIYKFLRGAQVLLSNKSKNKKKINIFYGGAISGNIGGTLVKIKRLKKYFPEHNFNFNVVYLLSNSVYLPLFALKILKKRKIPIVHNQNGVFYPSWYAGDYKRKNMLMARQYLCADYIFFQSEFCKKIAEEFLGKPKAEHEILYNAVDTNFFKPNLIKNYKNNNFYFLITGKFSNIHYYHLKNTILAICQIEHSQYKIKLKLAGSLSAKLKIKINNLLINEKINKNKIIFIDKFQQETANEIYNNADAFIYLMHQSPCPNSVIEAMSCGLPILYSNSGGVPEIVGNQCGIALKVSDSFEKPFCPDIVDIQEGIKLLINNYSYFSQHSRLRAVAKFDIDNWIKRHDYIFKKLINNNND